MTTQGEAATSPISTEQKTGLSPRVSVKFHAIPIDLKQADRWVLWRYEERDGKRTKVPYQSNGTKASSTDDTTWTNFEIVKVVYEQGGFDGVGFVLGNGFAGVDFDHCRDPATGEIDAWAKSYLDRLCSYSEVSPSGEGVHCILRASLLPGRSGRRKELTGTGYRPKAAVEMYSESRFFTVTGDRIA